MSTQGPAHWTRPLKDDVYRCSECGHGRHLTAWFLGLAEGTVEGSRFGEEIQGWEDTEVQESSLACSVHGALVEVHKLVDGVWCVPTMCPACAFGATTSAYGYARTCDACHGNYTPWKPLAAEVKTGDPVERPRRGKR